MDFSSTSKQRLRSEAKRKAKSAIILSRLVTTLTQHRDSAYRNPVSNQYLTSTMALADRRRINGPLTGTTPPLFTSTPESPISLKSARDIRPVCTSFLSHKASLSPC